MKKLFSILLLAMAFLGGCSLAAHTVKDVDKHIAELTSESGLIKTECRAGFYSGIAFGTDNLKIAKATQEMESLVVDRTSEKIMEEYRRCKAVGLEVSILAISGKENLDDAIKRVMSLGLF